jgi:glycosyltransferase involved in cell wall biosynthesis
MKNDRPQVAILVANLPAERDRRVIRECLTLEANGYDVTVIAPRGDKTLKILPGSRGTRLRPYPIVVYGSGVLSFAFEFVWSFLWIAFRLVGEVLGGRAHAVQVCNPPDVYWPLALLMRAIGRPWVFDHHDLSPEVYATRSGDQPNRLVFATLGLFERLTLRTASAVFLTNESFRENALRRGVAPGKLTVVRNGPALTEIAPADAGPVGSAGGEAAADRPYEIVYLGVLGPQDNVEGAVLAAEELAGRRGREDWRMTIAGDGETMPALTKLVAERGLGDVVRFAGWLEGPAVDALLRTATLAIQPDLPTRMNDLSTMAKTVEYLGRGIPVVAADLTETRRSAAEAAVYVPNGTPAEFAAAIDELLNDPPRRARMRQIGLARFAEQLAWEHQARQYVAVWHRLLARRRRRAGLPTEPPQATPPGDSAGPVAPRQRASGHPAIPHTANGRPAQGSTGHQPAAHP